MYSDDVSEESDSSASWVDWFIAQKGNEYFCPIEEDYILDRFNLVGIAAEIHHYQLALDLITDSLEEELDPKTWEAVDIAAKHLYGLVHARWVLTNKGLVMMAEKLKRKDFGRCPRVFCQEQPVLPVGLSDVPGQVGVKLYCPKCEDVYTPGSKKMSTIDGAYFTTSLPHLILQLYPALVPAKSKDRYSPKIFGFKVHSIAEEHRVQDHLREAREASLKATKNS